jgi:hypothetical protein
MQEVSCGSSTTIANVQPQGLSPDDADRRRKARKAYRQLATTLLECGLAATEDEAHELAREFSLSANTHSEADCRRLRTIGSRLRIEILSAARPEAAIAAATACLAFVADGDLKRLERALGIA